MRNLTMPLRARTRFRHRQAACLTFAVVAAHFCGGLHANAWAQEVGGQPTPDAGTQIPASASEAQVKEQWQQLISDSAELEAADPAAAIKRYQQFYDAGAYRFPVIGVQISLRIAHIWQLDLADYNKAIEVYEWALQTYLNTTGVGGYVAQLEKGRLAALELQKKAQAGKGQKNVPANAPTNAGRSPLAVPMPASPGENQLAINVSPLGTGSSASKMPGMRTSPPLVVAPSSTSNALPLALSIPSFPGNALGWQPSPQRCVTALARQNDGRIWLATEDSGVWFCDPNAPVATRWKQFTSKDGLQDNSIYALAVDKQGRVWAGTCNHGVSVWNGNEWRNYDVLKGPSGERVSDIAVCPTNGDVWIATNAGLTRYSVEKDSWSSLSITDGLPSNQIQAIAFDAEGNILVGTQCDGLAIAKARDSYQSWRIVQGPVQTPSTPSGSGLPTSFINDVLVARNGTFYVATPVGLAWSDDDGVHWNFVRGKDYAAKVRGRFAGAPSGWMEKAGAILSEDCVTCLAEDKSEHIWLGHWQTGDEILKRESNGASFTLTSLRKESNGFVRSIMTDVADAPLIARYDEGLSSSTLVNDSTDKLPSNPSHQSTALTISTTDVNSHPPAQNDASRPVPLPSFIKVPTTDDLNTLLKEVQSVPDESHQYLPLVVPLIPDWNTQGDWLGRYGRYWACLCAFNAPSNYLWGAGQTKIDYNLQISSYKKEDSLRYWVHWLYTDNPRVLEMPTIYADSRVQMHLGSSGKLRRESEADDHGETYPLTEEGPNIYASVRIPDGLYTLSLYQFNKDGEQGPNRLRDYSISVLQHPLDTQLDNLKNVESWPHLADTRIHDFRGGVYTKFLVRGPRMLTVKIARNNSFNTILAGIFLDEVNQEPSPYFPQPNGKTHQPSPLQVSLPVPHPEFETANELCQALEQIKEFNPKWWAQNHRRISIALAQWSEAQLLSHPGDFDTGEWKMLGTSYVNLNLFPQWEQTQIKRGLTPAREIEKSMKWNQGSDRMWKGREAVQDIVVPIKSASK